ncbi:hypothetical protein HO133_006903 [Letharia lupina]|uniref:Major facilitator superfamily (MFS) profile domain-containing protein n=1 Tax=Letharia lupina TaxID=560253 RepID=A0A8H6C5T2_9LECA|nr:uncharacterized protein HO133_006903 [Letharia lupina]KAF6217433.1 hypothetical protein HO133_006903 [Letharia lupina]
MSSWFLLDVAFYGVNLNQSVILTEFGVSQGANEYDVLKRIAIGNSMIAIAGYVPGYLFTIFFVEVEKLGRRWIKIQGFLIVVFLFAVNAGDYKHLGIGGKIFCLGIVFFIFGPSAATFIIPAEVFPVRVRAFGHGISAATGKLGAILSALLFNYLSGPTGIGLSSVLWIHSFAKFSAPSLLILKFRRRSGRIEM